MGGAITQDFYWPKYFFHTLAFRGSAPEPGIWNFVNLTGESNYVGVVKNAFKGSRLDIRCSINEVLNVINNFLLLLKSGLSDRVCFETS